MRGAAALPLTRRHTPVRSAVEPRVRFPTQQSCTSLSISNAVGAYGRRWDSRFRRATTAFATTLGIALAGMAKMHIRLPGGGGIASVLAALTVFGGGPLAAQERLCDTSFEDCRTPILELIRNEQVGIDVSYWFMTDARYAHAIIDRWRDGVRVRILLDLRADQNYPAAVPIRNAFVSAGIPIRRKVTAGINHWKAIIYSGQQRVHFSAANFADGSYSPVIPYREYLDEAVYFSDDPDIVTTFMRTYDDLWTDTTHYADFANVTPPPVRAYPTFPLHPDLNFPPDQDYADRLVSQLRHETRGIDAVIFRITQAKIPDELIRRFQAGVPVRVITERRQYRNPDYLWHAYNVDRLYATGIPIKWKDNVTEQDMHQKSVVLYSRAMAAFGSSNWTSSSSDSQREHNYFTVKDWIVEWFSDQFARKWDNRMAAADGGGPIEPPMFVPFVPRAPGVPSYAAPSSGASGLRGETTLRWEGGSWAHKYDIYFGPTSDPPRVVVDFMPGGATAGLRVSESYTFRNLSPATTYYWRIVGKTMANVTRSGPLWQFTTGGDIAPPPAGGTAPILADATVRSGSYASTNFGSAVDLIAKNSADQHYIRESYLKIDISGVSTTQEVTLRLFGALSDARDSAVTAEVFGSSNTTWSEDTVTWFTRPSIDTARLAAVTVAGTSPRWYDVDLTPYVAAQRASGATAITLVLSNPADSLAFAEFNSTEAAINRPEVALSADAVAAVLADAYVRSGPYASTNFGSAGDIVVKASADTRYHREGLIKFDVSDISAGDLVTIRVYGFLSDDRSPSVAVAIQGVDDVNWVEDGVTWSSRPAATSGTLDTIDVAGTAPQRYDIDVTSYVQARRTTGATAVTLVLKGVADSLPFASFRSRETGMGPRVILVRGT
jgi:phosphatidylserine/phosphatidylglycerophosphate/cardiolipin synthase-like enzyme